MGMIIEWDEEPKNPSLSPIPSDISAASTVYLACQDPPDVAISELESRLDALRSVRTNQRRVIFDIHQGFRVEARARARNRSQDAAFDLTLRLDGMRRRQELLDRCFDALLSVAGQNPPERLDRIEDVAAGSTYLARRGGKGFRAGGSETQAGIIMGLSWECFENVE
ncbi:hypothetical protein LTR95_000654 [Oleoguttula sp. CCFEE 5521]